MLQARPGFAVRLGAIMILVGVGRSGKPTPCFACCTNGILDQMHVGLGTGRPAYLCVYMACPLLSELK